MRPILVISFDNCLNSSSSTATIVVFILGICIMLETLVIRVVIRNKSRVRDNSFWHPSLSFSLFVYTITVLVLDVFSHHVHICGFCCVCVRYRYGIARILWYLYQEKRQHGLSWCWKSLNSGCRVSMPLILSTLYSQHMIVQMVA